MQTTHQNKKLIVGIILIVAFVYIVFTVANIIQSSNENNQCTDLESGEICPHKEQLNFLIGVLPLIASTALIVGAGIYYLMASKVEIKQESLKKNANILLKFLNEDEKKLVNLLIENNGKALQAEVSRLPGMTKVKSHRVVQKLIDKGVIEREEFGKTRIIKFVKEIKEALL
jgi:uncharacterized membrane protein